MIYYLYVTWLNEEGCGRSWKISGLCNGQGGFHIAGLRQLVDWRFCHKIMQMKPLDERRGENVASRGSGQSPLPGEKKKKGRSRGTKTSYLFLKG
jgi:hypothetical protein